MNSLELIDAYDALLQKALTIVSVSHPEYARLALLENDQAIIFYPQACSEYDSCVIEQDKSRTFPAWLLDSTEADIVTWRGERKRLDEAASVQWHADRRKLVEEEERRKLAELKAKYEGR